MPASYQAPSRKDTNGHRTHSQSAITNTTDTIATVGDLISAKGSTVFAVDPNDTIEAAATVLRDKRIGAVVVTDENTALVGILSERDIVRKLVETPGKTLGQYVRDVMTTSVETCTLDTPLLTILKRMTEGRFRHMPVVEEGALAGILTIGDVINFRLNELEHEALQLKQLIVG